MKEVSTDTNILAHTSRNCKYHIGFAQKKYYLKNLIARGRNAVAFFKKRAKMLFPHKT